MSIERKKRILIVDDSSFVVTKLKPIFEKNGFEVVGEAKDGQEAIEKFKELKPDLVTMDIVMPNMDGIQAMGELKKIDPDVKVIMISSMGLHHKVIEAAKAGAKNFILKPFKEEKVIEIINKVV